MADVKWIKIVTDIFDDEKIKYIETLPNGDTTIVIWFRILCLAGKSNSNGSLMMTDRIAYTDEMLASIFKRDIKVIQFAIATFEKLGMVELMDNRLYLTNWEKHQSIDKLEKIRENTRKRVANHRQKQLECNVTVTLPVTQGNATEEEEELEEDKEQDLEKDLKKNNDLSLIEDYSSDPFPPSETSEEMIGIVEEEFKRKLSISELKKINDMFIEYGFKKIKISLIEAIVYKKLSLNYMSACLESWKQKGYTLEQLGQGIHRTI